jgi:hypothetical protein
MNKNQEELLRFAKENNERAYVEADIKTIPCFYNYKLVKIELYCLKGKLTVPFEYANQYKLVNIKGLNSKEIKDKLAEIIEESISKIESKSKEMGVQLKYINTELVKITPLEQKI